jgi:subtilisin family serine protease
MVTLRKALLAVMLTPLFCPGAEPPATLPVRSSAPFPAAPVLREWTAADRAPGRFRRLRLLRTRFKYPLVRHERILERVGAGERVLRESYAVADHFMVRLRPGAARTDLASLAAAHGLTIRRALRTPRLYLVALPESEVETLDARIAALNAATGLVAYAELDSIFTLDQTIPDDTSFGQLWGLHNTGQNGGTPDADIDAPEAWDTFTGSRALVVGIVDGGTDYTHVDLASNIWTNPGEIPGNMIDDDGNGYVDDVHGYDFYYEDGDPMDDLANSHGTHTAGTVGALGDNGIGVAGVCWNVSLMPLKITSSAGSGPLSVAIDALHYAAMMRNSGVNLRVLNNSWGDNDLSLGLSNAVVACTGADILVVASAGNDYRDIDVGAPKYPASFPMSNVVGIANTTSTDAKSRSSNSGAVSVDLGAPGSSIYSTKRNNSYGALSGTSMSAPHVSGAAALLWALKPAADYAEIKAALLEGTDPVASMAGITVTGGRLNVHRAMHRLHPALLPEIANVTNGAFDHYSFDVTVQPVPLLNTNSLWMCWNTDGATNTFALSPLVPVSNDLFRVMVPTQALGTTVHYYLVAATVSNLAARVPAAAPAALASFRVAEPRYLLSAGSPENYGTVSPAYGYTAAPSGNVVRAQCAPFANVETNARLRCKGWTGTAPVPADGAANTVAFTLDRDAILLWRWQRQYRLAQLSDPPGIVDAATWWDTPGPAQTIAAPLEAAPGGMNYRLAEWRVDGLRHPAPTGMTVNPAAGIAVTGAVAATARYLPREQDDDGDRMEDWRELYLTGATNIEPAMRVLPSLPVAILAATDRVTHHPLTLLNVGGTNLTWSLRTGLRDRIGPDAGGWTHGGYGDAWHIVSNRNVSSAYAWYCGGGDPPRYASLVNAWLAAPPVRLRDGAELRFRQWIDSELDPDDPAEAYDGGIVEIATNGGAFFQVDPVGGYPFIAHEHINSTWTSPVGLFAGTGGWEEAVFDLGAYAGSEARVRFRFGSDWNTESEGWYIDDVILLDGGDTNLWLSAAPTNAVAAPGASNIWAAIADTAGLPSGTRRGLVRIVNNDPLLPTNDLEIVLTVDADPPSAVGAELILRTSEVGNYIVANTVTGAWSGFTDNLSGVAGYYYAATNGAPGTNGAWTTVTNGVLTALPDQTNSFYVWARDGVGLIGEAVGATILALDPGTDYDGDGALNGEEETAGTDATRDGSVLAVDSAALADGVGTQRLLVITWPTVLDRRYALHSAAALTNAAPDWVALMTNRPGTGGPMAYTDALDAVEVRFYRVGVQR